MATKMKQEAPWGYRKDGKPKRKPGRKTNAQRARTAARASNKTAQ